MDSKAKENTPLGKRKRTQKGEGQVVELEKVRKVQENVPSGKEKVPTLEVYEATFKDKEKVGMGEEKAPTQVAAVSIPRKQLKHLKPREFDLVSKDTLKKDLITFLSLSNSTKKQKDFTDFFMEGDFEVKPISPFRVKLETWRRESAWADLLTEIYFETGLAFLKFKVKKEGNGKKAKKK